MNITIRRVFQTLDGALSFIKSINPMSGQHITMTVSPAGTYIITCSDIITWEG